MATVSNKLLFAIDSLLYRMYQKVRFTEYPNCSRTHCLMEDTTVHVLSHKMQVAGP
jgi:hypothetical protein